jgi:hypothetical protein
MIIILALISVVGTMEHAREKAIMPQQQNSHDSFKEYVAGILML